MNDDMHLRNNRIGKLYQSIERLNTVGANTHTRIAWFRFAFKEHENAENVIPELEPEFFSIFGHTLTEVKRCRDIVRGFENYSPRLYENTFSEIYSILRNSWENTGHPWKNFSDLLAPHLTSLEHISDKASAEIGFKKLPSQEEIDEFVAEIQKFEENVNESTFDDELRTRLKKCAQHAKSALNEFSKTSENTFYFALEEIWKEVMFYVVNGKNGDLSSRKDEIKKSGIEKIMTIMNLFLGIINTGNALLNSDSATKLIQLMLN